MNNPEKFLPILVTPEGVYQFHPLQNEFRPNQATLAESFTNCTSLGAIAYLLLKEFSPSWLKVLSFPPTLEGMVFNPGRSCRQYYQSHLLPKESFLILQVLLITLIFKGILLDSTLIYHPFGFLPYYCYDLIYSHDKQDKRGITACYSMSLFSRFCHWDVKEPDITT